MKEKTQYNISLLTTLIVLSLSFIGMWYIKPYSVLFIVIAFICMLSVIVLSAWNSEIEQKEAQKK